MTNKMTNRKALTYVIENCDIPAEVLEKLNDMVEAIDRKASNTNRKPTAKQIENAEFCEKITAFLAESGESLTCAEVSKRIPELAGLSNQRVSALLRAIEKNHKATSETVKGKNVYTYCGEE